MIEVSASGSGADGRGRQAEGVFGYILITLLVIAGPLACFAGVDSRIDEKTRESRFSG
jgi:hypothetical protein